MKPRDVLTWKFAFYHGLLPALRRLGPARADAILGRLGKFSTSLWPARKRRLVAALEIAREGLSHLSPTWHPDTLAPELAAGSLRYLARDYLLAEDNDTVLPLFDVSGEAALNQEMAKGRGVVLVGSHFGGHIAAFHWLYRMDFPLRLMVQRPRHVTRALATFFDQDEPRPQSNFFLTRSMDATACVSRILNARAALREGSAVYLPGDIPWNGPNSRTGRLLGRTHPFLSVWADLAAITSAPVFYVICTPRENGRFALDFEPAGMIAPGRESAAVERYLARLDAAIAADPADAVAHLLWPCFDPAIKATRYPSARPSRRAAAALPAG